MNNFGKNLALWIIIGLLLIAQDVPPLRKPVARAVLWMLVRWLKLKRWRRMR